MNYRIEITIDLDEIQQAIDNEGIQYNMLDIMELKELKAID